MRGNLVPQQAGQGVLLQRKGSPFLFCLPGGHKRQRQVALPLPLLRCILGPHQETKEGVLLGEVTLLMSTPPLTPGVSTVHHSATPAHRQQKMEGPPSDLAGPRHPDGASSKPPSGRPPATAAILITALPPLRTGNVSLLPLSPFPPDCSYGDIVGTESIYRAFAVRYFSFHTTASLL